MQTCPVCKSDVIYRYKEYFEFSGVGEELLPKLGKGLFGVAKICPMMCGDCGYILLVASKETRQKVAESEHWVRVRDA